MEEAPKRVQHTTEIIRRRMKVQQNHLLAKHNRESTIRVGATVKKVNQLREATNHPKTETEQMSNHIGQRRAEKKLRAPQAPDTTEIMTVETANRPIIDRLSHKALQPLDTTKIIIEETASHLTTDRLNHRAPQLHEPMMAEETEEAEIIQPLEPITVVKVDRVAEIVHRREEAILTGHRHRQTEAEEEINLIKT